MPTEAHHLHRKWLLPRLKFRVWIAELVQPNETQVTLFWAGIIGFFGALASALFRSLTELILWLFTQAQIGKGVVHSFETLPWWQRLLIPALGGALAGFTIYFGTRFARKSSTDYMEAIVLGDGVVSARASLVKCLSALFSISSGASIGREGPLVQLSAVIASLLGRLQKRNPVQLRLFVACGAAAGIASAYNAPIGGALFVAEIVLRSLAMESFGPLVFSSVIATLTIRKFLGWDPLYQIDIPKAHIHSSIEILPYFALGILCGILAPWFLKLLRHSEKAFGLLKAPVYVRLTLGGLLVGALAILRPEVCGNGYSVINSVIHGQFLWETLLLVFLLKILATAATFGSGAVGGVFTPTLFMGACIGELYGDAIQRIWPGALEPHTFALVGMGAFLAGTTHAPLMAIIILFELTLDYDIILPLMLTCVVSHYICSAFEKKSVYSDSLERKGAHKFREQLGSMTVSHLMKENPVTVEESAPFATIAENFIRNRFNYLYVTDHDQRFRGVISLHDVKTFLNDPELAQVVIARDILRDNFPTLPPEGTLANALEQFSHHDGERLPVTESTNGQKLLGTVSKTDLLLALAEQSKEKQAA